MVTLRRWRVSFWHLWKKSY